MGAGWIANSLLSLDLRKFDAKGKSSKHILPNGLLMGDLPWYRVKIHQLNK